MSNLLLQAYRRCFGASITYPTARVTVRQIGLGATGMDTSPLKVGFKKLLAMANAEIETISVQDLAYIDDDPDTVIVDVRDGSERDANGAIPGSFHASRGMLEFHVDPESPVHIKALNPAKRIVLYCGTGGRSALAAKTLQDMGFPDVVSLAGGFAAWRIANAEDEQEFGQ